MTKLTPQSRGMTRGFMPALDPSPPTTVLPRLFILFLFLAFGAIPSSRAQGVRLEYCSEVGRSLSYRMHMEGTTRVFVRQSQQKSEVKTEMYLTQKITEFKKGVIETLTKIDSGKINVSGRESPIPYIGQQIRAGMKKNGEIVSTQGAVPLDLSSMNFVFPDRELNIGDSWTSSTPPSSQVPVTLNVTYKIVGTEKINGRDCVKIASRVRSSKDSQIQGLSLSVSADGDIYFAYEEGLMIKNSVDSNMDMVLKRVVNENVEKIITKMNMKMQMEYLD